MNILIVCTIRSSLLLSTDTMCISRHVLRLFLSLNHPDPSPLFYRQLSMNSNTAPSITISNNAPGVEPFHLSSLSHPPISVTNSYANFNQLNTQHNNSTTIVATASTSLSDTPIVPIQSLDYYNNSCNPS